MSRQSETQGRFATADSAWMQSFDCSQVKCLIVCRGPVRKEAFDVFSEMKIASYGMLLSEKDSIVYPRSLAPEIRSIANPANVHRVPDYMGVGQEEKLARIREIISIAKTNGYTHLFAGYGFMAEDADFIEAIERSGLRFIGPSSRVVRQAGAKDEAKKLARSLGNAVIPGVDNVTARALVLRAPDRAALESLAKEKDLELAFDAKRSLEDNAEALLQAGYAASTELVSIEELQKCAEAICVEMWEEYPKNRIRFKHIGGGGGKGQRVVANPGEVAAAVMDVLAEVKVIEPGSNRNFLIELNLETTRHNEIQLIGNGAWCLSLGGRDCSVQMHEQKLVEVSLTDELLAAEIETHAGQQRETLEGDRGTLRRMEEEGERFGSATGLDSVSTFECIVEGFNHFFMEMNTRIQVEHGVTELAYRLKFTNPDDADDCFFVDRLIEAMVLLAEHGPRLPKPERVVRNVSGLEIRLNATNAALQPHAGGLIRSWSRPLPYEIRDDQGIGTPNPDTGAFVYYCLAGAYDSNIALFLTSGTSRRDNFERMSEILRKNEIRGEDLQTNLSMHYGLINWMLGKGAMVKPSTRFMTSYLPAVGALQKLAVDVDLDFAAQKIAERLPTEAREVYFAKQTLLLRPLGRLLRDPHGIAGFLGRHDGRLWHVKGDSVEFARNPIEFLGALYHYLDLDDRPGVPPSEKIWDHDAEILTAAERFYARVVEKTGIEDWKATNELFQGSRNPALAEDEALWQRCVAAHAGFQAGLELLLLIPRIGVASGFCAIGLDENLDIVFPDAFDDTEANREFTKALAPPPAASSDEIVTPMAGAFYAREAPHLPVLVDVGDHFEAGQPLFIIEVMKMFNKVLAPFSGRVVENLMADKDGAIVKKGQTIFRIEPDERVTEETDAEIAARRQRATLALL